ncbi:hypothetical protein AS850_01435 [Frondihabitans sp. 762G35]|uniref:hypothetical protein n=1 Tax=Frondihabitans sp. 762G35 TaxID=1446794 RepID=UPI000D21D5DD|nr:hypothetical protein [Frondihabitans sp. 762G35]ARC55738.1 hypothetical protein AS850_01435 [Frondihabitans sp. 762G35]
MKFYLTKAAQRAAEGGAQPQKPARAAKTPKPTPDAPPRARNAKATVESAAAPQRAPKAPRRGDVRAAGLGAGAEPRVDLLPPEVRAERRSGQMVGRAWLAVGVVAALVVIGTGSATLYSASAKSKLADSQAQTGELLAQQTKYKDVRTYQAQSTLVSAAQSVGGSTEIDWNTYLAKVQASLPTGVTITSVTIDSTDPLKAYAQATTPLQGERVATLTFTATSAELPAVPTWLDDLTKLPGYTDASPGSVAFDASTKLYTANITMHITQAAYSGRYTTKDK